MNETLDIHPDFIGTDGRVRPCMSRRALLVGGTGAAALVLAGVPGDAQAQGARLLRAAYPRERVASFAALDVGKPLSFRYPYGDVRNIVVRLGVEAGGGIGPQKDLVAFNLQCPHMGGPMEATYKAQHQMLGPCPTHLTTFDLTRYGMVVSGHATESVPQIVLELDGDDVFAVGVQGLVFGYAAMTAAPAGAAG
jgi:arsenite oxidase small subunit